MHYLSILNEDIRQLTKRDNFKNFTRQIYFDPDTSQSSPYLLYLYRLNSIAKIDILLIEVYKLYFCNIYTKNHLGKLQQKKDPLFEDKQKQKYKQQKRLQRQKYSLFYLHFCQHIFLHSLLTEYQRNPITSMINDFFGFNYDDLQLINFTTKLLKQLSLKYYDHFYRKNRQNTFTQIQAIRKLIKTNINNLLNGIRQNYQQIKGIQYYPYYISSRQQLAKYVQIMFKSITKIHLLRRHQKLKVILKMQEDLSLYYYIDVRFPNQVDARARDQLSSNIIFMARSALEQHPIFTQIANLELHNIHNRQILYMFLSNIVKTCYKFFKNTTMIYPYITTDDIYFDQKSLSVILNPTKLLEEGLGIYGNTFNIEGKLTHDITSKSKFIQQWQKCHLQQIEEFQWFFIKKFYVEQQTTQYNKKVQKEMETYLNKNQIVQNCHIWRLFNILYYIRFNKHFILQQYKNKQQVFDELQQTIGYNKVKHLKKQIYEQVVKGRNVWKLLDLNTINNNLRMQRQHVQLRNISNKHEVCADKFTFNQIKKIMCFDDQDDDWLQLKYQKIKCQFELRNRILQQIQNLFNVTIFQKMLNIKKYILTYFSTLIQDVYQLSLKLWLSNKKRQAHNIYGLQPIQYKNARDEQNLRELFINKVDKKIQQYLLRQNSKQGGYLLQHTECHEHIRSLQTLRRQLLDIKKKIWIYHSIYLQINNKSIIQKDTVQQYAQHIIKIQKLAEQIYNRSKYCLQNIIDEQFNIKHFNKYIKINKLQYDNSEQNIKVIEYYIKKLVFCLKLLLKMDHQNWTTIQPYLIIILKGNNKYYFKSSKKNIEKMNNQQIQYELQILDEFYQYLQKYKSKQYEDHKYLIKNDKRQRLLRKLK